jgi:hypothetical protein
MAIDTSFLDAPDEVDTSFLDDPDEIDTSFLDAPESRPNVTIGNALSGARKLLPQTDGGFYQGVFGPILGTAMSAAAYWDDQTEDEKASTKGITAPALATAAAAPFLGPSVLGGGIAGGLKATGLSMLLGAGGRTAASMAEGEDFGDALYQSTVESPGMAAFDAALGPVGFGAYSKIAGAVTPTAVKTGLRTTGSAAKDKLLGLKDTSLDLLHRGTETVFDKGGEYIFDPVARALTAGKRRVAGEDTIKRATSWLASKGALNTRKIKYQEGTVSPTGFDSPVVVEDPFAGDLIDRAVENRKRIFGAADELDDAESAKLYRQINDDIKENERILKARKPKDPTEAAILKQQKQDAAEALKALKEQKKQFQIEKFGAELDPTGKPTGTKSAPDAEPPPLTPKRVISQNQEAAEETRGMFRDFFMGGIASMRAASPALARLAQSSEGALSDLAASGGRAFIFRTQVLQAVEGKGGQRLKQILKNVHGEEKASKIFLALNERDPAAQKKLLAALSDEGQQAFHEIANLMDTMWRTKRKAGIKQVISQKQLKDLLMEGRKVSPEKLEKFKLANELGDEWTVENVQLLMKYVNDPASKAFIDTAYRLGAEGAETGGIIMDLLKRESYVPHFKAKSMDDASLRQLILRNNPELTLEPRKVDEILKNMGQRNITEYSRPVGNLKDIETDIEVVLLQMLEDDAMTIANAASFGGTPGRALRSDSGDFSGGLGQIGEAGVRLKASLPEGLERDATNQALTRIYQKEVGQEAKHKRALTRTVSNLALTQSALTSMTEVGKSLWTVGGPRAWARGVAYVNDNPHLAGLFEEFGATQAPIMDLIARESTTLGKFADDTARGMPMELMGRMERWLRGPGGYGNVDVIVRNAQKAGDLMQAAIKSGEKVEFTPRMLKEASEIFPTMSPHAAADRLGTEWIAGNGSLGRELIGEGLQNLVRRQFYTTQIGLIGEAMQGSGGAIITQYKPFMIQATKHVWNDIVQPIAQGARTGDMDLMGMGVNRLAGLAAYSIPPVMASQLIKDGISGRWGEDDYAEKYLMRVMKLYTGTTTGMFGDAVSATVQLGTGSTRGIEDITQIPALSIGSGLVKDLARGTFQGDIPAAIRGFSNLGAATIDPRLGYLKGGANLAKNLD